MLFNNSLSGNNRSAVPSGTPSPQLMTAAEKHILIQAGATCGAFFCLFAIWRAIKMGLVPSNVFTNFLENFAWIVGCGVGPALYLTINR